MERPVQQLAATSCCVGMQRFIHQHDGRHACCNCTRRNYFINMTGVTPAATAHAETILAHSKT
jgi:hypothetical protein